MVCICQHNEVIFGKTGNQRTGEYFLQYFSSPFQNLISFLDAELRIVALHAIKIEVQESRRSAIASDLIHAFCSLGAETREIRQASQTIMAQFFPWLGLNKVNVFSFPDPGGYPDRHRLIFFAETD